MGKKWLSFNKVAVIFALFLFIIIVILSLYLFNIFTFPNFFSPQQNNALLPKTQNGTNIDDITNKKALLNPLPKNFANESSEWVMTEIPNSKIKVTSSMKIDVGMRAKFQNNAPSNSNAGIVFDNGLKEDDPNLHRVSLLYFLELKRWSIKYQVGKNIKYTPVIANPPDKIFGSFSLAISEDGKSMTVKSQNNATKTIEFSESLYAISSQMILRTQLSPKSNLTITSLNYQTDSQ